MEISKEELERYIAAIKIIINNDLFYLEDLSELVKSLIDNIPKLSEHIGLNSTYEIKENILIEAVKHITGDFSEFGVVNAFGVYTNRLEINYRVISWMENYLETILPIEEIHKMIKNKNHLEFIYQNSNDFGVMYDTNIGTDEYDLVEFRDYNDEPVNLDFMDLSYFSSKSFGMFLELDKYALDIETGKKYKFEEGLQVLFNGQYVPVYEVMSAKEITELFTHKFEKGSAYED